jgi:hypothetical protein
MLETPGAETENVENVAGDPAEKPQERDSRGRFAKGHKYKPRRFPKGAAVSDYRAGWLDNVTPQEFSNVVAVVLTRALSGDLRACEMLLDRLWPSINVSLDLDAGQEYRVAGESAAEHNERMLRHLFDCIEKQREIQHRLDAQKPAVIDAKSVVISAPAGCQRVSAELPGVAEVPSFTGFFPD